MKKILKVIGFIFLGFIALIILVAIIGPKEPKQSNNNQTTGAENKVEEISVSAEKLYSDYKNNPVSADNLYKDKLLKINGTISNIGKDILDNPYVILSSDDSIGGVQCYFKNQFKEQIATLQKGQRVVLSCKTSGQVILDLLAKECSVSK